MSRRGFMDVYRHYDERDGRGNARQWRAAFNFTMGLDQALGIVGDQSPESILGVSMSATLDDIKLAFKRRSFDVHPDRTAFHGIPTDIATREFQKLQAAYTVLAARHQRGRR